MDDDTLVENRKARYEYNLVDTIVAGMVLESTEVKSICNKQANISDGFCRFSDEGELWLLNCNIPEWNFSRNRHEPMRHRKLLLKNKELVKLFNFLSVRGNALVPLKFVVVNKKIKVVIGLAKGKQQHDKKQAIKERDIDREMKRELKG